MNPGTSGRWLYLVVGPAGAGKTTYCDALARALPGLSMADDLDGLMELVRLERDVVAARERDDVPEFIRSSLAIADSLPLAGRHATESAFEAARTGLIPYPDIRVLSDGFEILTPEVWDWVISWAARGLSDSRIASLQFARGLDPEYLEAVGCTSDLVYDRAFKLVLKEVHRKTDLLIIRVDASLETRLRRNENRRLRGEHSVAEQVMKSVYASDPFTATWFDKSRGFVRVGERRIPVWNIDNSRTIAPDLLADEADREVSKALRFFADA